MEAGKYTVELAKGNSTADTGFCVISIGDKTYYTDQIGADVKKNLTDATVKFDLWLSSPTKFEVLSHWGTSFCYGYKDVDRTEIFIASENVLDLTTQTTSDDGGKSEDNTDKSEENTTKIPSTNTTTGTETSSTQNSESTNTASTETSTPPETTGTSENTSTTESAAQTTQPASTEATTEI